MRRDVRIVLVGDEDSGKSSLITSLIKESFVDRVQPVLPEISLPPEVAPEGVLTKIIDTSSTAANRAHLEAEIRRSNVICIVYSISAPTSFDRIPTYWLPYIRSLGVNVPVILVGNKIDLRSGSVTNSALEDELSPVMAEFKEVETCVECSAKQQLNVSEVFYFAQKAVVYPTAPLYDSREHRLKPSCVDALRRIFRLCDSDKDSLLNDNELNDFQRKCFDSPLQSQELEGIKDLVLQAPIEGNNRFPYDHLSAYGGSNASHHPHQQQENGSTSSSSTRNQNHPHLRRGSLTLAGFLYLHTLFIQRGRLETTWTVLRTFGYGFDLTLEDSFVRPQFQVPADCSVELSPHGYQFLTDVFEVHDKDRDGALSKKELDSLFLTAPEGKHPFGNRDLGGSTTSTGEGDESFPNNTTITDENGYVTLQGWLAQWSMLTLLDHKTTLAYLAYLGYPSFPLSTNHLNDSSNPNFNSNGTNTSGSKFSFGKRGPPTPISLNSSSSKNSVKPSPPDTTSALKITKPRKLDRKKKGKIQRNVLLAYVLGAPGSGKTSILRHMIGSGEIDDGDYWEKGYEPTNGVQSVVSTVEHMGAEKYLVLQEFGSRSKEEVEILRSAQKLSLADVILYVYDSSDTNSFSYISNLRQQYPLLNNLPCLFVATKADLDLAQQRHEVQPDVYCQKLGLNIPSLINSTSTNSIHNLNGNGSNNNFSGPLSISVKFNQTADLYHIICSIALDPRGSVPFGNDRSLSYSNSRSRFLFYVGIVLLGGGVAFYSFKVISPGTGGLGLGLGKWKDAFGNYNYATTGGENTSNAGGSKWLSWLRSGM